MQDYFFQQSYPHYSVTDENRNVYTDFAAKLNRDYDSASQLSGPKRVVVSCGPIPAKLDAVKYLTNKFKGGLAFQTAIYLAGRGHQVTIVRWFNTPIPEYITKAPVEILDQTVEDVYDYYDWFQHHAKDYDAFVMAAAVANLAPVEPYKTKFPSHNYKPGDQFDIKFTIAPRAIDIIKQLNPRACLIGYKLLDDENELINAARITLKESKANLIFANTPQSARIRKDALTQDGSVIPCSFQTHLQLIDRAIRQKYYRTEIVDAGEFLNSPEAKWAAAIVKMYDRTFQASDGYGTVAVPIMKGSMFMTTARGHQGGPVLVTKIDHENRVVYATGKATLNTPALDRMLDHNPNCVVIHRHSQCCQYRIVAPKNADRPYVIRNNRYIFPGTAEEADFVQTMAANGAYAVEEIFHGYIKLADILPVDWTQYRKLFPEKYFSTPQCMEDVIKTYANTNTLEIGGGTTADATYNYDPYVTAEKSKPITLEEIAQHHFMLAYARNAVNYIRPAELHDILIHCSAFIANTFLVPPEEKITDNEAATLVCEQRDMPTILHALRLEQDQLMIHKFYAYTQEDYENLGLTVTSYGRNSALVTKNIDTSKLKFEKKASDGDAYSRAHRLL